MLAETFATFWQADFFSADLQLSSSGPDRLRASQPEKFGPKLEGTAVEKPPPKSCKVELTLFTGKQR